MKIRTGHVAEIPQRTARVTIMVSLAAIIAVLLVLPGLARPGQPDHSGFDYLLKKYVENGLVDYIGMKRDHELLISYIVGLRDSSAPYYEEWDRDTRIAFWINAYNAITIHAIVINYPIEYGSLISRIRFPRNSIRQIKDVWSTPYFELAGQPRTLDEIEHRILRAEFGDPRIHFTLVCASIGCPLLAGEAYSGRRLGERLDEDADRFANDREKVRIDTESNKLLCVIHLQVVRRGLHRA